MSTTGRFRSDLIAAAAGTLRDAAPKSPGSTQAATPYANWLDRMQRTRGRHAAITKNLYTWSSYKNWAERVRDTWEEPETKADLGPPGNRRPR